MHPDPETKQKKRLNKTDWLSRALDMLSRQGDAELRIDRMCKSLGVTKGSFYAHFEDRADFVRQLVEYWIENYTQRMVVAIDEFKDEPPEARLLALMRMIQEHGAASQDIPFRAWATHDATVAAGVKHVDRTRFEYVGQIFHAMGFRGADLDLRTRLFVVYHSTSQGVLLPASNLDPDEEIKRRHEFLIRH